MDRRLSQNLQKIEGDMRCVFVFSSAVKTKESDSEITFNYECEREVPVTFLKG